MKLIINVPLSYSREYLEDLDENTLPNVGDDFEEKYYVKNKTIENDVCTLDLGFKKFKGHYPDEKGI